MSFSISDIKVDRNINDIMYIIENKKIFSENSIPKNDSISLYGESIIGPAGPSGESIIGPTGLMGPTGYSGESIIGPTGPCGESIIGSMGPTGTCGESIIGPMGPTGTCGESIIGPTGLMGPMGPMGPTGQSGKSIIGPCGESIMGPTGQSGKSIIGPTGPCGESIIGPTGPANIFQIFSVDNIDMSSFSSSLDNNSITQNIISIPNVSLIYINKNNSIPKFINNMIGGTNGRQIIFTLSLNLTINDKITFSKINSKNGTGIYIPGNINEILLLPGESICFIYINNARILEDNNAGLGTGLWFYQYKS